MFLSLPLLSSFVELAAVLDHVWLFSWRKPTNGLFRLLHLHAVTNDMQVTGFTRLTLP